MKDQRDSKTGNLLTSPGARRQAELKARRLADGYRRSTIWIKQVDFDAGVHAAELGSTSASDCPPSRDRLSWMMGYCQQLEKAAKGRALCSAAASGRLFDPGASPKNVA